MATNILVTKLYSPLLRRNLVPRPRLIERLGSDLFVEDAFSHENAFSQTKVFSRKLTLITAPAGYGKTTLAVTWVQQTGVPVAWLSLDEHDNDPVHFLNCLVASLSKIQPDLVSTGSLAGQGLGLPAPEMTLTPLINAIASARIPIILAMDDYHVIRNVAVHQLLNFLLENLPPCMHLVLVSREDPPAPLPRLRAAGQVIEIRQADLRFSRGEVADFFHRFSGAEISSDDLDSIIQKTEGWVVGLQMLTIAMQSHLSLQSGGNVRDFLQSFTESNRFIMDYLMDEVFNKQPVPLQKFLLKIAILDRLSAPLCEAITGRKDSAEILSRLEAGNAFLIPLDPTRDWYRFHHLLTELLRQRLRQSKDIAEKDLQRMAGEWLYQHGSPREAIGYALAGEDWQRAAEWIHEQSVELLKQGEILNLLNWFLKLPEAWMNQNPRLALDFCWTLILSGQLEKAERFLDRMSCSIELSTEEQGSVAASRAFIARSRGDSQQMMDWSEKALALLPNDDQHYHGLLSVNLGIAYWHMGQLWDAERVIQNALQSSQSIRNHYVVLTSQIFLGRVQAARGQLRHAFQAYQPLCERFESIPILALAHMDIATLHYEWNELDACATYLEKSIRIAERTRSAEFQSSAYNQLARLRLAKGQVEETWDTLRYARQLLENQAVTPLTWARSAAAYVQMALSQGDLIEAERWVELAGDQADAHPFYPFAGLSRARLLMAQRKIGAAQEELARASALATHNRWGYARVEILVLQALASNTPEDALAFLGEALTLANPEGFLRTFVDAGEPLAPLLREAARRGIFPEYAGRMLALIESEVREKPGQAPPGTIPLVESLSERELEVLRLVAAGRSNRQIADQLVVSLSTVKSHVHNVSGKLDAQNRTQMAARARELKLI